MSTVVRLILVVAVVVAQSAIPARMIWSRESVLRHGTLYRFRTQPVDPYDAFRGRYVWLSLEENSAPIPKGELPTPGETVYAILEGLLIGEVPIEQYLQQQSETTGGNES